MTDDLSAALSDTATKLQQVRAAIGAVIFGQQQVIDHCLAGLLCGGHLLLVGVPGLGKTKLAETVARALGLSQKRVQGTPDLLPADITGSEILEETTAGHRHFRFVQGPIFAQVLMMDEINRASPRTQSALLQAMQELKVTVAGVDHSLPQPFHVLATQNPLEHEGTYPLPEAQLDRFLMQVNVTYPDAAAERHMALVTTGTDVHRVTAVMTAADLMAAQQLVRRIPISDMVMDGIMKLVRAGRPESTELPEIREQIAWGPGPRAVQALALAARARALLDGRLSPSMDDVVALAEPVLQHRLALHFAARASGIEAADVIRHLCKVAA